MAFMTATIASAASIASTIATIGQVSAIVGGIGMTAAAIATPIATAVTQAQAQEANAKGQEKQMRYNQRMEEREAEEIERETAANARRQHLASQQLMASQRAALGKSGAAMDSGSPLALLGAAAANEQIKSQDVWRGGYRAAQQHRSEANMYGYQAGIARMNRPSGAVTGLSIVGGILNNSGSISKGISGAVNGISNLAR